MNSRIVYTVFLFLVLALAGAWIYFQSIGKTNNEILAPVANQPASRTDRGNVISGSDETILPVIWGNLGVRMVESGVIDSEKFRAIYQSRGGLDAEGKKLLYGTDNGQLKINPQNAGLILNLLWAFGLGNKNDILENGEMADPRYGGAGNFASTAGWTVADGSAMSHYSAHLFVVLTREQQDSVDKVSRNIYRPCCGNSTHFPDCNHGMAMLGLLELMAFQGVSENDMYKYALKVNELWFPDNYATIGAYLKTQGRSLETADPKEILGINYSSVMGYQNILKLVAPPANNKSGGCGV